MFLVYSIFVSRDFKSNMLYICINDKYKGHNLEQLPTRKCEVLEMEEKYIFDHIIINKDGDLINTIEQIKRIILN